MRDDFAGQADMETIRLDILEAEGNLYKYVAMLKPESKIILYQGDIPVAEIHRLPGETDRRWACSDTGFVLRIVTG